MIRSIPLGTYVPGASMIHRTPPMVKFCTLILAIIGTSIWVKSLVGTGRRHYDRAVWFGHACRVAHAHHHH